jgi:signal transduction histidine kinase
MTIRSRLLVTYLALTGVGMLVLAGTTLLSFQRYFLAAVREDLGARATAISESVGDWLEEGNEARTTTVARRYGAQEDMSIRVFAPEGRLIASSEPDDAERGLRADQLSGITAALEGRRTSGEASDSVGQGHRLFEAVPIVRHGKVLGAVRVSRKLDAFRSEMVRATMTVTALLLLTFAAATLVSIRLARQLASPIQKMRDLAVALGRGRFGERLQLRRNDELGQLATELNHMGEQLAALDEERRAFLASASHELRTPISNVKVTLEALENGAAEDPTLRDRFVRTAVEETNRMAGLIHDLLDLGRLEAGVAPIDRQATDLRYLADRLTRAMEPRLREAGLGLETELVAAAISIDTERVLQALFSIVDNALKFAPTGSTIRLRSWVEKPHAMLSIADEGPGIDPEHLTRVFDQFFTADPARPRGGTGLGLTIARKIIEAHGGTIEVANGAAGGAPFTVVLPLRTASAAAA